MLWTLIRNFTRKAAAPAAASGDQLSEGIAGLNAGDFDAACRHLRAVLAADPNHAEASYYLGLAEARSGRLEQAETLLESARLQRDNADVNNALGNVRRLSGRLESAAESYRQALKFDENHLPALANLGLALRDLGEPGLALPVLDRALVLAPDHAEALFNKALALVDLGESANAEKLIDRALSIDPNFAHAHLQRAFLLLKRREFAEGWREYAWRVRIPEVDRWQDHAYPLWQGETLAGKRLLVQAEQGLGDQIMFASCLPEVIASAQQVIVECDPRLAKLFARSFPRAAVYRYRAAGEPDWSREPAADYRTRCGDLPRMLRNRDADFPRHTGYLVADPARTAAWHERLASLGPGLKVGISWRGGTRATGQTRRSIALKALLPILSMPGTHFVSLQYGDVHAEVAEIEARHGVVVHAWANADAGMDDVAALIASLDLVITVCTTAAHLAGALGKSAWVMVPVVAEWRYLREGSSIPWYPKLRLFRQERLDEWSNVLAAVKAELAHEVASRCE
jgi:tetratricopeptide (TPR) repeat protein